MSAGFALLWSKILDSSIWMESKETRLVWITMLAMKDSQGRVICSPKALAHRARVEVEECGEALRLFLSPDIESGSKVDEGRRLREIPGGWQIINHEMYRFSTEARREFWREQKRKQRDHRKSKRTKAQVKAQYDSAEKRFVDAVNNGDEEQADRIAGEGL